MKEFSEESEISYNTLKKIKYGERKITKFSLGDAINLSTLWYRWEAAEEIGEGSNGLAEESAWFDE